MKPELQKLYDTWTATQNKVNESTVLPQITFDSLTNAIISAGPFYYYIVDFHDMSLSHVSPSIYDIHGFDPKNVVFNDILAAIHPDDINFISMAETSIANFFYKGIGREKFLTYKTNYCFRSRMKNGAYSLISHQAVVLTLDTNGGIGKSLNIHTQIDHLSNFNTYQISIIGLNNEPSYLIQHTERDAKREFEFSKREIDIIKHIGEGMDNNEIGKKLYISPLTVKKHRSNILAKSGCQNMAQLIKSCILQGFI